MSPGFTERVRAVVASIPAGEVLTYGEVAVEAGRPGAARAVGRIMASSGGSLPWWRVVAADGRLVPGNEDEHRRRLHAEDVPTTAGRVRNMAARPDHPTS